MSRLEFFRSLRPGSDVLLVDSQQRCRPVQAKAFEGGQMIVCGPGRVAQSRPVTANGGEHSLGVGLEQVADEAVRMLCRDGVSGKATGGKSRRLPVAITSAPPLIAAASTWRSSGSGRSSSATSVR